MSDRYARNGEDMLDVLAHDISRYKVLGEGNDANNDMQELLNMLAGDDLYVVEVQDENTQP